MKNIALLSLPYLKDYMRNARCDFVSLSGTQWYPIWLGFLGAFLEKHHYNIKLIDAPAYDLNFNEVVFILDDFKPDFLVVYTGRLSEEQDIELTEKLMSKYKKEAVFVGPYASINPVKLLKKAKKVKFAVSGEFEYPVKELIEGKRLKEIKNLIYRKDDEIFLNPEREYLKTKELDKIPFVTDFFARYLNLKKYKAPSESYPFIDMMTGRGCSYGRCTFCLWVNTFIKGSVYNKRSIDNVLEEFKFIRRKISQVKSVMIQDDTLTISRAKEISEGILKKNIKMKWSCYARANMDYETLKLMKKAGCLNLHVGFESADNNILCNIRKGITMSVIEKFVQDAHKASLNIHADFAFGFPGETKETMEKTLKWAKKIKPDTAQFQLMIPFPKTKYYQDLLQSGNLKNGEPNFKNLTSEEMRIYAKKAYRSFYFNPHYLKRILRHPIQHFFLRFDTYSRAIPSMFWSRWVK